MRCRSSFQLFCDGDGDGDEGQEGERCFGTPARFCVGSSATSVALIRALDGPAGIVCNHAGGDPHERGSPPILKTTNAVPDVRARPHGAYLDQRLGLASAATIGTAGG